METIEYPKMLLKDNNHAIADDANSEKALRDDGWLTHDELNKPKAKTTAKAKTNDTSGTGN